MFRGPQQFDGEDPLRPITRGIVEKTRRKLTLDGHVGLRAVDTLRRQRQDRRVTKDVVSARSAPRFVGREHELQRLTQRLRSPRPDAVEVLLIAGEPGVGKTRLMQEAVTVARGLRWLTLVGHAYDTEGMPPYLPFIEALQEYASVSQPGELEARLAEAGPEVALLVPALRRTPAEPASTQSDPETQRYRLFESVCDFLLKTTESSRPGRYGEALRPAAGPHPCADERR